MLRPADEGARLRDRPGALRCASFIGLFFFLGVLVNSFTNLPLTFLLKERLRLDPRQLSWFFAVGDWAWYVKPAFGLVSDRVPLWGSRRRSYLLLMAGLLLAVWTGLALAPRYEYGPLLGMLALSALALAFMNTVTAGLLAELSRAGGTSGRLNSLRQFATQAAILAAGPAGGWAAAHWSFERVSGGAAGAAAALLFGTLLLVREPKESSGADKAAGLSSGAAAPGDRSRPLLAALQRPAIWLALGFILLVELAPGFNTPLLFYEKDVLRFPKELFGEIQMAGALGAIVGAGLYARLCRRRPLRQALPVTLMLHAVATLAWLWLLTPGSALLIKGLTGFTLALASLSIFDLATRAAPRGVEGTVLALIFAGVNIAGKGSDLIGSSLYAVHWSLRALVLLNAGTTLIALIFLPLLPATIVSRCDGEAGG